MAELFQFDTLPLEKWRDCLRDINFWLDGYLGTVEYNNLEEKLDRFLRVHWNFGVGPTACFTRAISSIVRARKIRRIGPFDYVIEVDMKQAGGLSFQDMLTIKVAEVIGLLDHQEYNKRKEKDDEVQYCSYGLDNATSSLYELLRPMERLPQIMEKMSTKMYLLVVSNLHEPIKPIMLDAFTQGACLPPPSWKDSFWLVSTMSKDVYDRSKPDYPCTIDSLSGEDLLMLTLYSLHQAAKYIFDAIGDKDEKYWHIVALRCFHYAALLLIPYCSSSDGKDEDRQTSNEHASITPEELIRHWAAQGILPVIKQSDQERMDQVTQSYHLKYNDNDIYQIGNVILEAFLEYSLLQLPFSSSTKAKDCTKTAAHFLVYCGLIVEDLTIDEFSNDSHAGLERLLWISHVADRGWHVSRDWLSHEAKGPTTLIIRHCSGQSRLFTKLDHLLAKSSCICVLDLSYSPLTSLPSSVCHLPNLRLLSLRGCNNLSSPFNFPSNLPGNNSSNMIINLLYLDFSYSNVKAFGSNFFRNMPNLQALMLNECSNLVELPPSIVALTNLEMLELTGTEIKSFSVEIFAQMLKLRSLKLINNKNLLLVPEQVSKASRDLINQHTDTYDSIMEEEVKLEGHPTLRSFSLIDSRHIKKLSLCGCRKLETVDIKKLDVLEELNISATAIKELPADIPNLPRLRQLLLMGVPSLKRFPWHELQRFPDDFYLDQCSCGNCNKYNNPLQGAQVCISDSKIFYSFNYDTAESVRNGKLFKSFYVRVTSCMARHKKMHDEEDTVYNKKLQVSVPAYADVNRLYLTEGVSMVSMDDVPPFQEAERHMEISAVERYPHGLRYLLKVTKSLSMTDDTHVSYLSDLSDFDALEDCMLRRCHQMVSVFDTPYGMSRGLRNACVSQLKSLTHFDRGDSKFYALKHLRLEKCPRLEGVMHCDSALPSLVTLDILFCYNLKAIFYHGVFYSSGYQLPCLRRMHLQELPLLKHFCDNDVTLTAPAWAELNVRGCWSLRRLPRLDQQPDKKVVEVSGERAWWAKLQWDQDGDGSSLHRGGYEPLLPPLSASFRERVVIKSYLR